MDRENKELAANHPSVYLLCEGILHDGEGLLRFPLVAPYSKLHNKENSLVLAALLEKLFIVVIKKVF